MEMFSDHAPEGSGVHVANDGADIVIRFVGVVDGESGLSEATARRTEQSQRPRIFLDTRKLESLRSVARRAWFEWFRKHCTDVDGIYVIGGGAIFRMAAATLALVGIKMRFVDSPRDIPNAPASLAA